MLARSQVPSFVSRVEATSKHGRRDGQEGNESGQVHFGRAIRSGMLAEMGEWPLIWYGGKRKECIA